MNAARFRAGETIGITYHVASILGSYGFSSPTYFPSPGDVTRGNGASLIRVLFTNNGTIDAQTGVLSLDGGRAFVGFTAATGDAFENHDILGWSFRPL